MFAETGCFDPTSIQDGEENRFYTASMPVYEHMENGVAEIPVEELSHKCTLGQDGATNVPSVELEAELQHQMAFEIENCYNDIPNNPLMQDDQPNQTLSYGQLNWAATGDYEVQDMSYGNENQEQQQVQLMQNGQGGFCSSSLLDVPPYPQPPDLLNLLHLQRSPSSASLLPNTTISFANASQNGAGLMDAASSSSIFYDPLLHLNLPPQPPIFKDLFQSLPHGFSLPVPMTGSLFARMDEMERSRGLFQDDNGQLFDDGVLEFSADMPRMVKGRNGKLKPFATERDRRDNLNNKYTTLKSLIPSPKKSDRASIVEDAIEYIKELTRTITELKVLVEKKRCVKERMKRLKTEETSPDRENSDETKPKDEMNGPLRSSWLQRKSKDTEVDVRIIDDELTVKLSQRKKINCLLTVSKILEELQLDLQHVSGGQVGDFYSFIFNTKIREGSSVYAGGIANKVIEGVEKQQIGILAANMSY